MKNNDDNHDDDRPKSTEREEVPPVQVLLARQEKERLETEDLLAGFDRPGRTPKPPASQRDFVAHYATPKTPSAKAPASKRPPHVNEESTFVLPRKKKPVLAYGSWALLGAAMAALGLLVVLLATRTSDPRGTGLPTGPSAATTITGATTFTEPSARDEIPAPDPNGAETSATPVTITSTSPTRIDPRPLPAATTPTEAPRASAPRPSPRQDFIRDF